MDGDGCCCLITFGVGRLGGVLFPFLSCTGESIAYQRCIGSELSDRSLVRDNIRCISSIE